MKKPNAKPYLVLMLVTLVASGGLCYIQYGNYTGVTAEVAKLRAEKKNPEEVQLLLAESQGKLAQSEGELGHLEKGVPEIAYVPTLLKELEKAGKDSGIEVLGIRPIPVATTAPVRNGEPSRARPKPYTELDIQVNGRGSYAASVRFVKALQMFPKILAARTVSMQPKVASKKIGNDSAPLLDVTFELRAFLFKADDSGKKQEEAPAEEKTINISGRNKAVVN